MFKLKRISSLAAFPFTFRGPKVLQRSFNGYSSFSYSDTERSAADLANQYILRTSMQQQTCKRDNVINGRHLANLVIDQVKMQLSHTIISTKNTEQSTKSTKLPVLGCVLVGNNEDSHRYVALKKKACLSAGIHPEGLVLPGTITQERLEAIVREMNEDARISGIMIQLPLPRHINPLRISGLIKVEKDVDGLHPTNIMSNNILMRAVRIGEKRY